MQQDPITAVRQDIAAAAPILKPYFDRDSKDAMQLTEMLITLIQDPCPNVMDAAENSEGEILKSRKKNKDQDFAKADKEMIEFQKGLAAREKIELEERKKRSEQEEESKYDMHSMLNQSHKKWRG